MEIRNVIFLASAYFFILSGCGPSVEEQREDIEKAMKSWIGKSETELVAKWGAPTKSYKTMDGSRELTYIYTHRTSSPGYGWYDYWGHLHISRPRKHQSKTERDFTVDQAGTVIAYHWDGF